MPIYEYRCDACRRLTPVLVRRMDEPAPACAHCGSSRMRRVMSRFASPRSEEARLDALTDPSSLGGLDESDPRSVARWMKRMSRETGDELGAGLEEEIDRAVEDPEGDMSATEGADREL